MLYRYMTSPRRGKAFLVGRRRSGGLGEAGLGQGEPGRLLFASSKANKSFDNHLEAMIDCVVVFSSDSSQSLPVQFISESFV